MSNITIPLVTQNIYSSQVQVIEPADIRIIDSCKPELTKINASDLTILFPKTSDTERKTVPLMGGSIVKISLGQNSDFSKDDRYSTYYKNINEKIKELFNAKNIGIISEKSTSSLRVYFNRLFIDEASFGQNLGIVPNLYLSTTSLNMEDISSNSDYFGTVRKNAVFSFLPIESIRELLKTISLNENNQSTIGSWSGLSGKSYKDLYDISIKESPEELEIISLILDLIPFFNISQEEMLVDPVTPSLGGYFTIINKAIYLKMPDISGIDSAGFGTDYLSQLNLLFQLITDDFKTKDISIKNIELKKVSPNYSSLLDISSEEYDLKSPTDFSITFSSTKKPSAIYLSPAIGEEIDIKNNLLKFIRASQSGSFIEYTSYPNPFVSILDNKILLDYHASEPTPEGEMPFSRITAEKIDQPFYGVKYYLGNSENNFSSGGLGKIRATLDKKYNKNLGTDGPIGNYLKKVFTLSPNGLGIKPEDYYGAGFPIVEELYQLNYYSGKVIGQPLSTYEFVGNLSRESIILHPGKAYNDNDPESAGKSGNNAKFFKKNFIANQVGLCQNYRPRVFSSPEKFIPTPWIKSSSVNTLENGDYSVSFSASDFLKFYTDATTEMKFVAYTYDGESQVSKIQNGYIDIRMKPPEIINIIPDGTIQDAEILTCGKSRINIETKEARNIDLIKINGFKIYKNDDWILSPGSISFTLPCEAEIVQGEAEVIISQGDLSSSAGIIYIANGSDNTSEAEKILNLRDLPSVVSIPPLSADDVLASNLKISGQNYEIPISYTDPRSLIKIKSNKGIFKEGRDIYLYLGFKEEDTSKQFSQEIISYTDKSYGNIYVAKDFSYMLNNFPGSDFYRKNKNKAFLYFPGNSLIDRPLELLTKIQSEVYLIISTNSPQDFSTESNLGVVRLGGDGKKPFVGPPLVIGMAANYDDKTSKNHLSNFLNEDYIQIADYIIEKEGILNLNDNGLIDSKDKFKKLIVLFSYRELKKLNWLNKNISLYINEEKVDNTFLIDGVKRATSIDKIDSDKNSRLYERAKTLYYFVITGLNGFSLTLTEPAKVRVELYDPDFNISISSKDKYKDYSIRIPKEDISLATDDSNSIFIKKDISKNFEYLFGDYDSDRALTGFFLANFSDNIFKFDSFPGVSIKSNLSGTISSVQEFNSDENKISLFKDSQTEIIDILPNSWFTFTSGSEVKSGQYLESDTDYLIFFRLQVFDICKIALLMPRFLDPIPDNLVVSPGGILTFIVENILDNFIIEIAGVEAKIVATREIDINIYEVDVIIPEGIPEILTLDLCGYKLYNGNQTLGDGDNQLGELTQYLGRAASGVLGKSNNQFDQYKKTLEIHPIKFISSTIDAANVAKEFITSFCNYSFKITADLSINLQGFSQLLIPVKVIFCIIDVICNIFNPFQLPQAIIRLFECLYDLILLLPQISIPVMFFNLLIHLLDFLECLIVKILGLITAINLIVDAFAIAIDGRISFREALMLEQLLLKYVIALEADLELMGPITQVLGIFLQLLSISFRFPCSINPASTTAPCGIDGFELSAMISGLIAEPSGSAPHIVYNLDKKYLLPIAQPFTDKTSESFLETYSPPSYNYSIEPVRGDLAFDATSAIEGNLYDISYFNSESMRKKNSSFDSDVDDIDSISSDSVISLKTSYTKRRKHLSSQQGVIFKFNERTWKSLVSVFDKQIIDEYQSFDTPPVLLEKDGVNLNIAGPSSYGNLYSMIDGKSMITISDGKGTVNPLTLEIVQNGVAVERTFDTIPSMVLMDENLDVYVIEEGGIIFGEYNEVGGSEQAVVGIKEIRATIISQKSSTGESFSKEDESVNIGTEEDPVEEIHSIFSLPQLYFVDTRVAAEAIQSKCETAAINQLPLDITGDGGEKELGVMSNCINDFLNSIKNQTITLKQSLSVGKVPSRLSQEEVESAYIKLIDCTNNSITNLCSIVVNPLNTSFKLINDVDNTPILPDPVASSEEASGADGAGPPLTGAREYAGGIGDAATVTVGSNAFVELIPRDSYDNLITYDLSSKARLQIISDETGGAIINLSPIESNLQNYWSYNSEAGSYLASITSSSTGKVKIKVTICSQAVQALTYSDLIAESETGDKVNCVDGITEVENSLNATPLGALSRIDRILTITFAAKEQSIIIKSNADQKDSIITEPQLFGTVLEN